MQTELTLPCEADMVGTARSVVAARFAGTPRRDDAVQIVSEFVTNSTLYSLSRYGGRINVIVDVRKDVGWGRIEVEDGGSEGPPLGPVDLAIIASFAGEFAEHGRGLLIVRQLADRWGQDTYPRPRRAVWWAELDWKTTDKESRADEH
jgi:anti-sigma regulatory factor (Ser/Thr protein kinase)